VSSSKTAVSSQPASNRSSEKARQDSNKTIKEKGEQAAYECGVVGLDPRILLILGRLTSAQLWPECLMHSIEMSQSPV